MGRPAAGERRKTKDWYDIAFVLINNDHGGPSSAASAVNDAFGGELCAISAVLDDLAANFAESRAQGPQAYAEQVTLDHPEFDLATAAVDAAISVETFLGGPQR